MKIQRKIEITQAGLVKATIRFLKEENGKSLISRQKFVGYGLTVAEATAKAIKKSGVRG